MEDKTHQTKREGRKRWRDSHRRESSWVTPLEDLVSLSPRMKVSRKCLFAFNVSNFQG